MTDMDKILELLEQQVINKTLNLEGISHVQKIVDENKLLKTENESLKSEVSKHVKDRDEIEKENRRMSGILSTANAKIAEYEKKDKEFYEKGVKFEYEQKRGNELKEILGMALRNTTIRQSMFGSTSFADNNGYPMTGPTHNEVTTSEE